MDYPTPLKDLDAKPLVAIMSIPSNKDDKLTCVVCVPLIHCIECGLTELNLATCIADCYLTIVQAGQYFYLPFYDCRVSSK